MAFRKYHGITLAGNSWIENLHVERLATDPTPLVAGRIWYNETDKALRFSSLDSEGAVAVVDVSSAADLAALEAIVNTINGDSTVDGSFRKEIANIIGSAPEALDTLQEIATALNNDPNLYNTLVNLVNTSISDLNDQIIGTATEAMDTLGEVQDTIGNKATLETVDQTSIVAAINEVVASVSAVRGELMSTQVAAGLSENGLYTADANSNYLTGAESLKDADNILDAALKAESERALAAEGVNAQAITDEATARANADAAIQSELDATQAAVGVSENGAYVSRTGTNYLDGATSLAEEVGELDTALKAESDRAIAAEGVNAQAVADEAARATAVEGALEDLDTTDKSNLVAAINEVVEAVGDGTDTLKAAINGKKAIYTAPSAQLTHTFNHGFAGADLAVTVMVYDDIDSKWYNDSVMIEVDPATTTVTVPLQVAAIVKIIVEDLSDIA